MPASKLLVYRMLASRAQIRITSGVAIALFVLFVATLFLRMHVLRPGTPFVPITSAILIMADWITATLLVAQALVLRARPLHMLAAGYFFTGLFVVLRVLTIPGVLTPVGPFDPNYNTPFWFYLASHAVLPLAIMAYAWLSRATDQPAGYRSPGRALAGSVILAGSLILAATVGETSQPWSSPIFLPTCLVLLLTVAAMIMLNLTQHSVLDLWLLLVLWGWFLELALIALPAQCLYRRLVCGPQPGPVVRPVCSLRLAIGNHQALCPDHAAAGGADAGARTSLDDPRCHYRLHRP